MILRSRIVKPATLLAGILLVLLSTPLGLAYHEGDNAHHEFAAPEFERTWARTDRPVSELVVDRTWMWGPEPYTGGLMEEYAESPNHMRQVQYFDKSRMEINNPNAPDDELWFVTNGLLAKELITGERQVGDAAFEPGTPADVNVAGDPGSGPSYADLTEHLDDTPHPDGQPIVARLDDEGGVSDDPSLAGRAITAVHVADSGTNHNIANVFWAFMNSSGVVWEEEAPVGGAAPNTEPVGQAFVTDKLFENPFYGIGFPITEAYWVDVNVGGTPHLVLLQCFERRCLTYTEENEEGWQVESGNVGQHYYIWRYGTHFVPSELLFVAHLTGDQEVPAVESEASGYAVFCLSADGTSIRFQLSVENITDATAAHIHMGAAGTSGDVLVPLFTGPAFSGSGVLAEGTLGLEDVPEGMTLEDLFNAVLAGETYVNVHTTAHEAGEIRGQIMVADDLSFTATLDPDQEVGDTPVESDASGTAHFFYDHDTASVSYHVEVSDIDDVTASHIHLAPAGESGPIVAPLETPLVDDPSEGVLMAADLVNDLEGMSIEQLVCEMLLGNTYVNVHTTAYPGGEIRGQIAWLGDDIWPTEDMTLTADLDGANEVDAAAVETDATGSAVVTVHPDGTITYVLVVADIIDVTAAHIHIGYADETGDVLAPLYANPGTPTGEFNGILSEGMIEAGDLPEGVTLAELLGALMTGRTYVNVHTDAHPAGEIRGQLNETDALIFVARLSGDAEVPPVDTDASGVALFWVDPLYTQIDYVLIVSGIEDGTAAHIHLGGQDLDGDVIVGLWSAGEGMSADLNGLVSAGVITEADLADSPLPEDTLEGLAEAMEAGGTYVNVHSTTNPDGEVRGQIEPLAGEGHMH
jgi:hypothetical protein